MNEVLASRSIIDLSKSLATYCKPVLAHSVYTACSTTAPIYVYIYVSCRPTVKEGSNEGQRKRDDGVSVNIRSPGREVRQVTEGYMLRYDTMR
jgi:hypothetical protein